jgi:hypothetical protein
LNYENTDQDISADLDTLLNGPWYSEKNQEWVTWDNPLYFDPDVVHSSYYFVFVKGGRNVIWDMSDTSYFDSTLNNWSFTANKIMTGVTDDFVENLWIGYQMNIAIYGYGYGMYSPQFWNGSLLCPYVFPSGTYDGQFSTKSRARVRLRIRRNLFLNTTYNESTVPFSVNVLPNFLNNPLNLLPEANDVFAGTTEIPLCASTTWLNAPPFDSSKQMQWYRMKRG